jgi:hypothetical protein
MVKQAKQSAHSTFRCPGECDRHVRTVHEKRRDHACPHCAAAFALANSLTRHVRAMHRQGEQSDDEEGLLLFLRSAKQAN